MVLTDLRMPGMDGIELLAKIKEIRPETMVIVMTAYGTVKTAVQAMKLGAEDYLSKPIDVEELEVILQKVLEKKGLLEETRTLRERLEHKYRFDNLVGESPEMLSVFKTIRQVAPSFASVLLLGESGTGKELFAQALHQNSPRRNKPFVKVACAALPETLLESELFGHEKGSFTGAVYTRAGRFEAADGGTLFLDEIGDITPTVQVKLLRFLEEREFERVGGNKTYKVDVRIVAATHRDLKKKLEDGSFREDLYYRLNVIEIHIPPLRERPGDIPLLAHHFLRKYAEANGKDIEGISDEVMALLLAHPWPGNVRELENAMERAVVLTTEPDPHARPLSHPAQGGRVGRPDLARRSAEPGSAHSGQHPGRARARGHPAHARVGGRKHVARRLDPRHQRPQDPVQAEGVPAPGGPGRPEGLEAGLRRLGGDGGRVDHQQGVDGKGDAEADEPGVVVERLRARGRRGRPRRARSRASVADDGRPVPAAAIAVGAVGQVEILERAAPPPHEPVVGDEHAGDRAEAAGVAEQPGEDVAGRSRRAAATAASRCRACR